MTPDQFYRLPAGERTVVTALCEKELELVQV